jgi:hypothetical protein
MTGTPTDATVHPARLPWNNETTGFHRGWAAGYAAGLAERPWERLRRLVPVALVVAMVVALFAVRTPTWLRILALWTVALVVFLAPLWLAVVVGMLLWHVHSARRLRRRTGMSDIKPF